MLINRYKAKVIVKIEIPVEINSSFVGNNRSGRECAEDSAEEVVVSMLPEGVEFNSIASNCVEYELIEKESDEEFDDQRRQ